MLCGLWCEKVSSRGSLHIPVFSCERWWHVSLSISPCLKGALAGPGYPHVSVSCSLHWGFRERLHSSSFISTTNHGQITKLSLPGLLSFIGGRQLLLLSFCYLPSSRERQHLAFYYARSCWFSAFIWRKIVVTN